MGCENVSGPFRKFPFYLTKNMPSLRAGDWNFHMTFDLTQPCFLSAFFYHSMSDLLKLCLKLQVETFSVKSLQGETTKITAPPEQPFR